MCAEENATLNLVVLIVGVVLAVPVALIIRVTLAVLYDEPLEPAEIVSGDAKR